MRAHYREVIEDQTFEEIQAIKYLDCEFKNCIFKDTPCMTAELIELMKNNRLIGCWYNPTTMFARLISSLHEDVNLIDFLNKAILKSSQKTSKKLESKQLVLFDIDQE